MENEVVKYEIANDVVDVIRGTRDDWRNVEAFDAWLRPGPPRQFPYVSRAVFFDVRQVAHQAQRAQIVS